MLGASIFCMRREAAMETVKGRSAARSGKVSRRRLLHGAIGGSTGIAGLWLLACSGSNNNGTNKPANAAGATTTGSATTATRAAGTAAPVGSPQTATTLQPRRGGALTFAGAFE